MITLSDASVEAAARAIIRADFKNTTWQDTARAMLSAVEKEK